MSKFLSYLEHIPSSEIVKSYNYPFKSFKKQLFMAELFKAELQREKKQKD